jgi:twitching motility protein PilT
VFPADQQAQVRTQLSATLQGVVCQTLCKTADGAGRRAAVEIMVCTPAVRAMIRDGKLAQLPSTLQTGEQFGMQTLNQHLAALCKEGVITYDMALEKCSNRADLDDLLKKR